MKVPKDFPDRVAELSSSTPREAIANLLSALMPRVEAQVRAPTPVGGMDDIMRTPGQAERPPVQPDPMAKLVKKGRRKRWARKTALTMTSKGRTKFRRDPNDFNLSIFARATTVGEALDGGLTQSDLTYAEKNGTIYLGEL